MNKKTSSGLTLIELLVAVVLFVILVALAAPNMQSFMRSNRLTAATNDLVASLNLARSAAVKRTTAVKICISNVAQDDCDTGTGNWENGWITFIDADNDNIIDSSEKVLRVSRSLAGGTTIRSPQFGTGITITFKSDGSASDGSTSVAGSFKICDEEANAKRARGINISQTGLISAAKDTDNDDLRNIYSSGTTWGQISCP